MYTDKNYEKSYNSWQITKRHKKAALKIVESFEQQNLSIENAKIILNLANELIDFNEQKLKTLI